MAIEETIRWLGFKPWKITYSSDNFQKLYDLAEKLIELGNAYVCHCSDTEIKLQRGGEAGTSPRYRCEHANQDVETNLKKFRRNERRRISPAGRLLAYETGHRESQPADVGSCRLPNSQGPAPAFPHHGNQWRIYPTYDFTHCLCDSFENITHSLCTTEFVLSRESYEWLNKLLVEFSADAARVWWVSLPYSRYMPRTGLTHAGRLNISGTVMSKRALKRLVEEKIVRGWDDPRLYTIKAIRRRGVPPGAILSFVNELGVTTALTLIQIARFEQTVRRYLETTVPRLMLVLDPVAVIIEDAEEQDLEIPFSPKDPKMGTHTIRLTKKVFIDRSDFREVDSKDYFRLAPGKSVGLLQVPYPIKATSFTKDEATGKVTEIKAVYDKEGKKPKTFIQWVPDGSRKVEVRIHSALFKSEQPQAVEGGYMNDLASNSETIYPDAMVESGFEEVRKRALGPRPRGRRPARPGPRASDSRRCVSPIL